MPDIVIHDLVDFPQWLPVITSWFQGEWQSLLEERAAHPGSVAATLVAFADGELAGTVALRDHLFEHRALPVVAGLYVLPQFRGHGVASRLLRAAEHRAREVGITRLYMFTQAPHALYGAYGWHRYADVRMPALQLTMMEKWLTPQRLFQPPPPAARG